ncbi:carboxymuconolactone decarboxylase family protein [Cupriavidus basilensis]|uniref:carboxymuconolactone decarboxylase family protein n=1 Tax=Cupriavidus basilensis TaxID=68895 RepID=UPI0020A6D328|nr:carboxymuconolactone decarboxylase family protein [Cupriavidus basilensis]MCP3023084.1 carboxymuconolactone decarboxylase family protein [Cupriavidus basilensis]
MSRLHTISPAEATGQAAQLFAAIKGAVGKVPNAYAVIGSNAPEVLAHALQTGALLKNATLSTRELEAINLAVSEASGCDYCVAAHTMTGKMAGYTAEQTRELRAGEYPQDSKIDALVRFALAVATTSGTVPASVVANVREAGYTDRQIIESIQAISAILFTNMINRVNDTVIDFPKVA